MIEQNKRPETVLASLDEKETAALATQLREPFDRGRKTENTARAVLEGLRSGGFAPDGHGALLLAAFLRGADAAGAGDFRLDDVLAAARG